jgi:hypothetical protein
MRVAVWAYTIAVGFASLAAASLGGLFHNIYSHLLGGKPLPALTQLFIEFHLWALAIPLPWLLAAIWLSRRETATQSRCFAFAGVSTLAITFIFAFTANALTLPFVSIVVGM